MYESQSLCNHWFLQSPGEVDLINPVLHMIMKPAQGVSVSSLWSGDSHGKVGGKKLVEVLTCTLECAAQEGGKLIDEQDK